LAWQINEAAFTWGTYVDHKIRQNANSFDKKGVHKPIHDINALLGLSDVRPTSRGDKIDYDSLEVRPFNPADWDSIAPAADPMKGKPGTVSIEDFLNDDGSVIVDTPDDRRWTSRKQYLSPQVAVTKYAQRGRGKSRIVTPDEVPGGAFGGKANTADE
jgi:hypothetical protein